MRAPGADPAGIGDWRLVRRLGQGAFAVVWHARDDRGRDAALKVLNTEMAGRADARAALAREAKALVRLHGRPHIVDVYEYSLDDPPYVAMQYVAGHSLAHLIDHLHAGGLGAPRSVALVDQVATALEAAHAARLVHLDVTPANIMVGDGDVVHLLDFGLVAAVSDPMLRGQVLFESGLGSLRYKAPERLVARMAPTYAVDVFALTCVLFECLTGRAVFGQRTRWGVERALRRGARPRPGAVDADLSRFDDLVRDGLAVDPADRIATVPEFRRRLADAAGPDR